STRCAAKGSRLPFISPSRRNASSRAMGTRGDILPTIPSSVLSSLSPAARATSGAASTQMPCSTGSTAMTTATLAAAARRRWRRLGPISCWLGNWTITEIPAGNISRGLRRGVKIPGDRIHRDVRAGFDNLIEQLLEQLAEGQIALVGQLRKPCRCLGRHLEVELKIAARPAPLLGLGVLRRPAREAARLRHHPNLIARR